jgi:FKBP-type peptidyl-prolyl cis-trans isomerase SlyD
MKVELKKVVGIEYTLTLEDGEVADTNAGQDPLLYIHGFGGIIPGLEKALEGLSVGDKKQVTIEPKDAYGEVIEEAFQELPLNAFPKGVKLEEGLILQMVTEEGYPVPAIVDEVKEDSAVLDLNHPLAGRTLSFDVKVVEIRDASPEELEHGHAHGPHGHHH